jgi:pimeloyl-ACP methyl ester carboxylesterase
MNRQHFNYTEFYLVGHDRGARVSHRIALDHPEKVKRLMVMDIAPTLWMYDNTNMMFVSFDALCKVTKYLGLLGRFSDNDVILIQA